MRKSEFEQGVLTSRRIRLALPFTVVNCGNTWVLCEYKCSRSAVSRYQYAFRRHHPLCVLLIAQSEREN